MPGSDTLLQPSFASAAFALGPAQFIEPRAEAVQLKAVYVITNTTSSAHTTCQPERPVASSAIRPGLSPSSTAVRHLVTLFLVGQLPWVDASLIAEPVEGVGLTNPFGRAAYLVLLALGLLAFIATKTRRCLCGGLSILGLLFLPCAAFLDLAFVWCAVSFSCRHIIQDERMIPEGMRDLHPVGGGPSKRGLVWKYDGSHGKGEVQLFKKVERPEGEVWEPQEFISPAAAWVYYLDEFKDEMVMTAETCVTQLYQSLWIFSVGACVGFFSMGVGILIAWTSSDSVGVRVVGMFLAVLRTLIIMWRWTADLLMSNHHRGARLRRGNLPGRHQVNCRDYRRQKHLDVFPKTETPDLSDSLPGTVLKILMHTASQRVARLFQSWWLDWCASHYDVYNPDGGPTAMLDVRFWDKSHIVTMPQYIADGLGAGATELQHLAYPTIIVTAVYIGLVGAQLGLFVLEDMSVAVWGATGAAIVTSAWLRGPLVCSGIT